MPVDVALPLEIEIEVDNQSRAFFSLQNDANLVIPCEKHVLLDTQNTKNHYQSINLTRVVSVTP